MSPDARPSPANLDLLLALVRPEVEAQSCPSCGQSLESCRLEVAEVTLDEVRLLLCCPVCQRWFTLSVGPSAQEGKAGIR
jgi:hypothetical protein